MGHPETQTQETSRAHGPRLPEPSQTCQGPPRLRKGCLGPQRTGFGCFPKKDACTPPGLFCTQVRGSEQFFPGAPWGKNPNLGNQGLPRAHPVGKSAMIQARGAQKHPDHSLEPPRDGEIDLAWVNFCSEGPVSSPVLSGYFVSGQIFTLCPYRFALHPFFRRGLRSWPSSENQTLWLLVGSRQRVTPSGKSGKGRGAVSRRTPVLPGGFPHSCPVWVLRLQLSLVFYSA